MAAGVIDVWMQHPTVRHSQHEMFDSLRLDGVEAPTEALPLELTIAVMDEGGVETDGCLVRPGRGPHLQ
jgi:hypothetical protein